MTAGLVSKTDKEIVRLHNSFINAIFSLSVDAKKILLVVWLHSNPEKNNIVEVYQKDIQDKVGIDIMHLNKEHREEIIEELMKKIITIKDIENPNNFVKFALFRDTEYKNGLLRVDLSPKILPYIKEAQEKLFTRFKIQNIKPLTSSHAIRIYLLLKQFEDTSWREIDINEFKKMLELEYKYKRIYDLKKYVLEVAKKQINENTDIKIDYELIKKGKKYTKIRFTIKRKNKEIENKELHSEDRVQEKKEDNLTSFRLDLLKKSNVIIQLNDEIYELKNNLLYKGNKILDRTEAFNIWQELYKNKDKIKIIENKEEFEKEQEEKRKEQLKQELLKNYFGKKYEMIEKNVFGKYEMLYYEILKIEDITFKEDGTIDNITLLAKGEDGLNYKITTTLNQLRQNTK